MIKDKLRPRPIEASQPCGNGQRGALQEYMNHQIGAGTIRHATLQGLYAKGAGSSRHRKTVLQPAEFRRD